MIRVGFAVPPSWSGWLGGLNYVRNLIAAVVHEQVGLEPVILDPRGRPGLLESPGTERIASTVLDRASPAGRLRRAIREVTGRDLLLERLLRRHRIDALSHSEPLRTPLRTPVIAWLADVQHRRLPELFDAASLAQRDRTFERACRHATLVVASSEAARRDLERFFPAATGKVRVLRFADASAAAAPVVDAASLEARHGFSGRYLLLPNQFWAHKNHAVVLRALKLLADRGRRVLVLATGNTGDYRKPGLFADLMKLRDELGVVDQFRCLGVVPYADLASLARGAVAMINPSRFEGWSTSVEEAKALGKAILLSRIDVHLEQAPERAGWFDPDDADALARLLWEAWEGFDPAAEREAAAAAAARFPARRRAFAEGYAAIVREAVDSMGRSA
jgi:glycosyltransferase involved in cell wall biosynthesis